MLVFYYTYYKILITLSGDNTVEEDFKGLFTRFSADVIATAAFGIQVDSLTDQENEFYKNGMKMMNFSLRALLMFIMLSVCPKIMKVRI